MLAVADMLGVPEEDHEFFRENFGLTKGIGAVGKGAGGNPSSNPLSWLDDKFRALHRGAPAGEARPT